MQHECVPLSGSPNIRRSKFVYVKMEQATHKYSANSSTRLHTKRHDLMIIMIRRINVSSSIPTVPDDVIFIQMKPLRGTPCTQNDSAL